MLHQDHCHSHQLHYKSTHRICTYCHSQIHQLYNLKDMSKLVFSNACTHKNFLTVLTDSPKSIINCMPSPHKKTCLQLIFNTCLSLCLYTLHATVYSSFDVIFSPVLFSIHLASYDFPHQHIFFKDYFLFLPTDLF